MRLLRVSLVFRSSIIKEPCPHAPLFIFSSLWYLKDFVKEKELHSPWCWRGIMLTVFQMLTQGTSGPTYSLKSLRCPSNRQVTHGVGTSHFTTLSMIGSRLFFLPFFFLEKPEHIYKPQPDIMQGVRDLGMLSPEGDVSIKAFPSGFRELCRRGGVKRVRGRGNGGPQENKTL